MTEVEPRIAINETNTPGDANGLYRINQPGSYYLTGNVQGVAGKQGITVAVSGVTIDLNGFEVVGVPGSTHGISAFVSSANVAVRNGTVRNWGGIGVSVGGNSARASDLRLLDNGGVGMQTGNTAIVERCTARGNLSTGGITMGTDSIAVQCNAFQNTGSGIAGAQGSKISLCIAEGNTINGISAATGGAVDGCTSASNGQHGIQVGEAGVVTNCATTNNGLDGVSASTASVVSNCAARTSGRYGYSVGPESLVSQCVSFNSAVNGVSASTACLVRECVVNNSGAEGIQVGTASSVIGCSVESSATDGILAPFGCTISGNNCRVNGLAVADGAGIHVTGGDNRIEGNHCTAADRGIDAGAAGNLIIGNRCSGNTANWVFAAGNSFGPIVVTATNAAAISTNAATAGTVGSVDPHANIQY